MKTISTVTRRRLDIQGFTDVNENLLTQTASWLRFAYSRCVQSLQDWGLSWHLTQYNAMCSHKINIEKKEDVTNEVLGFIKIAYEKAG